MSAHLSAEFSITDHTNMSIMRECPNGMTDSSALSSHSSIDWSASYHFHTKKGVTSVCTLPGQAELANRHASLRGANFQSRPHGVQDSLYPKETAQNIAPSRHHHVSGAAPRPHGGAGRARAQPREAVEEASQSLPDRNPMQRFELLHRSKGEYDGTHQALRKQVDSWRLRVPTIARTYPAPPVPGATSPDLLRKSSKLSRNRAQGRELGLAENYNITENPSVGASNVKPHVESSKAGIESGRISDSSSPIQLFAEVSAYKAGKLLPQSALSQKSSSSSDKASDPQTPSSDADSLTFAPMVLPRPLGDHPGSSSDSESPLDPAPIDLLPYLAIENIPTPATAATTEGGSPSGKSSPAGRQGQCAFGVSSFASAASALLQPIPGAPIDAFGMLSNRSSPQDSSPRTASSTALLKPESAAPNLPSNGTSKTASLHNLSRGSPSSTAPLQSTSTAPNIASDMPSRKSSPYDSNTEPLFSNAHAANLDMTGTEGASNRENRVAHNNTTRVPSVSVASLDEPSSGSSTTRSSNSSDRDSLPPSFLKRSREDPKMSTNGEMPVQGDEAGYRPVATTEHLSTFTDRPTFVPRPSILRNPSYAIIPHASPVRKSVAFEGDTAEVGLQSGSPEAPQSMLRAEGPFARLSKLAPSIVAGTRPTTQPSAKSPLRTVVDDMHTDSSDSERSDHLPQPSGTIRSGVESPVLDTSIAASSHTDKQEVNADAPATAKIIDKPSAKPEARPMTLPTDFFTVESSQNRQAVSRPRSEASRASSKASRDSRKSKTKAENVGSDGHSRPRRAPEEKAKATQDRPASPIFQDAAEDEVRPSTPSPPEAALQPIIQVGVLYDCVQGCPVEGLVYRSGVKMPLIPRVEARSLGCSKVANALRSCRDSSIYKRLRKLVWRFHLDLEDLNKRRQYQWLPLAEHCIALVNRMIGDLGQPCTFRSRWERGTYGKLLGNAGGRERGTIFFVFEASIPYMQLGAAYAVAAREELLEMSLHSNEYTQATLTDDPVALSMLKRHETLARSVEYIESYFLALARYTMQIRDVLLVSMTRLFKTEVERLLSKADIVSELTPAEKQDDSARRRDIGAWLDWLLGDCLRKWETLPSKGAYEQSLKCFRNYDRVWEEEGPSFGLLRSMFCLGVFLPRDQRTKLVGWHFVDKEPVPQAGANALDDEKSGEEDGQIDERLKASRRAMILAKIRARMKAFLLRILEIFASKEDEDDLESLGSVDNNAHAMQEAENAEPVRATSTTSRSSSGPEARRSRVSNADEGDLCDDRYQGPGGGSMSAALRQKVLDIVGNIGDDIYSDYLLEVTEERLKHFSESSSLPNTAELDQNFPFPVEPKRKASMKHFEWECLKEYIRLLNEEVNSGTQLWNVYLAAVEACRPEVDLIAARRVYDEVRANIGMRSMRSSALRQSYSR